MRGRGEKPKWLVQCPKTQKREARAVISEAKRRQKIKDKKKLLIAITVQFRKKLIGHLRVFAN